MPLGPVPTGGMAPAGARCPSAPLRLQPSGALARLRSEPGPVPRPPARAFSSANGRAGRLSPHLATGRAALAPAALRRGVALLSMGRNWAPPARWWVVVPSLRRRWLAPRPPRAPGGSRPGPAGTGPRFVGTPSPGHRPGPSDPPERVHPRRGLPSRPAPGTTRRLPSPNSGAEAQRPLLSAGAFPLRRRGYPPAAQRSSPPSPRGQLPCPAPNIPPAPCVLSRPLGLSWGLAVPALHADQPAPQVFLLVATHLPSGVGPGRGGPFPPSSLPLGRGKLHRAPPHPPTALQVAQALLSPPTLAGQLLCDLDSRGAPPKFSSNCKASTLLPSGCQAPESLIDQPPLCPPEQSLLTQLPTFVALMPGHVCLILRRPPQVQVSIVWEERSNKSPAEKGPEDTLWRTQCDCDDQPFLCCPPLLARSES